MVNASGAWANVIARMAGAVSCRCDLAGAIFLFRRRWLGSIPAGRLFGTSLMIFIFARRVTACCSVLATRTELAPGDPPVDGSVKELLAEKIRQIICPAFRRFSISRGWAGFRTLTPDGRFIIGWDPR